MKKVYISYNKEGARWDTWRTAEQAKQGMKDQGIMKGNISEVHPVDLGVTLPKTKVTMVTFTTVQQ